MYSLDTCSFTTSHCFKSKSYSSERTKVCSKALDDQLKVVYLNINKLIIFLISRNKDTKRFNSMRLVLESIFPFVKASPRFYLCPILGYPGEESILNLKTMYLNKTLLFSAKNNITDEPSFLLHQLEDSHKLLSLCNSSIFTKVNTCNGGISYYGSKLMYIFIPREQSIQYVLMLPFLNGLKAMQSKKASLSSNRGASHKVFFEDNKSNYVDLGVGVSRFMRGLYKKTITGVSDVDVAHVNAYFNFVQEVVKKHLPHCLMNKFNDVLNYIGLEDFSKLQLYSEKMSMPNDFEQSQHNENNYSFMPSASFGTNNLLPLHTDEDMFLSIVHVHALSDIISDDKCSRYELHTKVVKYFTFNNGNTVAMRSGDILVFNPTIPHCVSSNTDHYRSDEVFCVSHYFKSLIAGRNNNNIVFDSTT